MKALVLQSEKHIEVADYSLTQPTADEVMVRMRAAGLNRRDYWIQQGLYPGLVPPVVLGSDGVGEVVEVGDKVDRSWLGKRYYEPKLRLG